MDTTSMLTYSLDASPDGRDGKWKTQIWFLRLLGKAGQHMLTMLASSKKLKSKAVHTTRIINLGI